MVTKHIRPEATVEFSDTAAVSIGDQWFSPFQRNSYTARVTFPDGRVRIVVLPTNARMRPEAEYVDVVIERARRENIFTAMELWT